MKKISVVLPAHIPNERYLAMLQRSIASLACQTFQDFKLILILNDCYDGVYPLVDCFLSTMKFESVVVEMPERPGLGYALKKSEPYLDTKYTARLDADDYYMPDKLQTQYDYMEKHPDIDFLFTSGYDIYDSKVCDTYYGDHEYLTHKQIERSISYENIMLGASVLCKTSTLMMLGGFQLGIGREDYDLWLKAMDRGYKFAKIPEKLYAYTQGTSVPRRKQTR